MKGTTDGRRCRRNKTRQDKRERRGRGVYLAWGFEKRESDRLQMTARDRGGS